ncbi:glycosyl hydrolase family 28-related protein [Methylobacterium tardum]|uniref:glycosyl hydrolase family 28-related protein n=1 Tax=Methylobacterium tardum TaxID=374432 RepID=UPI0036196EFB
MPDHGARQAETIRFALLFLICLTAILPAEALDASSTALTRTDLAKVDPLALGSAIILSGFVSPSDRGAGCMLVRGSSGGPNAVRDGAGGWWQAPMGHPMDVTCFGAKMDGKTDDSAAVQAAIAAATLSGAGGQVLIPGGRIRLGGVSLPNNIRLSGAGANATAVFASTSSGDIFSASDPSSVSNVAIENLSIYSAGVARQTEGHYVLFRNCTNCRVSDFLFSGAYIGAEVTGANTVNVALERGRSDGASLYHFAVSGGSDTFLRGLLTTAGGGAQAACGVRLTQSGGTWISDSDFTASGHGTCVQPGDGQGVKWTFVSNTALGDSGTGYGLFLNPVGSGAVYGFSATNAWTSANKKAGVATQCDRGGTIQSLTLNNHRAIANTLDGMTFSCGDGIRIVTPTIVNNSNPDGGGVVGRNSGIVFGPGVSHFTVNGGEFRALFGSKPFQAHAVRVMPGASNFYTIQGVDAVGGTTTQVSVQDAGTGSQKNVGGNW